jgi:O-antigen ligase
VIFTYLLARRGISSKLAILLIAPLAVLVVQSSLFIDAWVRGETASHSIATLSGRTEYWSRAFEVVERSPIIGTGLSSGSRYEVLAQIGHSATSTIHNTWIEAYLGTGLLGTIALAFCFLYAWKISIKYTDISLVPLLVLVTITVRSITGTSIELASSTLLFFLMLIIALWKAGGLKRVSKTADVDPNSTKARGTAKHLQLERHDA